MHFLSGIHFIEIGDRQFRRSSRRRVTSLFPLLFLVTTLLGAPLETDLSRLRQRHMLLQVRIGKKWGYVNEEGKTEIEPRFNWSGPFSEGLAAVQVHGKWGYVDKSGKMVINPQFNYALPFSEGLAAVETGEETNEAGIGALWGYINTAGEYVIKPKFWDANTFSEGLAAVMTSETGDYAFVGRDGEVKIQGNYGRLRRFSGGLAVFFSRRAGRVGIIDKDGEIVIKAGQFPVVGEFSQGLALAGATHHYGFIDTRGNIAIPFRFEMVRPFSEGFAAVSIRSTNTGGNGWGFIDTNGAVVIQPEFKYVGIFSEGLAPVQVADKWGFVDRHGELTIEPQYAWAETFEDGVARVWIDAYPDPPIFFHSVDVVFYPNIPQRPRYDYGYISKSGRFGYIDKTGNYIWKSSD